MKRKIRVEEFMNVRENLLECVTAFPVTALLAFINDIMQEEREASVKNMRQNVLKALAHGN